MILSCKKKDTTLPNAIIDKPFAMTHYFYDDIVTVSGTVTDETGLKSVKIELIYPDSRPTGFSYELSVSGLSDDFTKSFSLDDKHLPSGNYYIKVAAIDLAGNRKSAFAEVTYTELPLALEDIFLVTKNGNTNYDLFRIDSTNNSQFVRNFQGNFQDMLANSYWGQLLFSGGSTGNLINYIPYIDDVNFEKSPQPTSMPFFGKLKQVQSDKRMYVSRGNNSVISYDKNGLVQNTVLFPSIYQPDDIEENGDFLLIEEKSPAQNNLNVYFRSTHSLKHQFQVQGDVVKILPRNNNEVFLIVGEGNSFHLYVYYVNDNYTYEPSTINSGVVYDACLVNENEIFICHSTGILKYTANNNSMVPISSYVGEQIEYDQLFDRIVLKNQNEITFFNRFGNQGTSYIHNDLIDKFVLFYNK